MNFQMSVLPLLIALLFVCTLADGTKYDKSENTNGNTTVIEASSIENESKNTLQNNLNKDSSIVNTTKVFEKLASYPKKVHSLKKRPRKTPTAHSSLAPAQNTKTKRKKVTDVTAAFKDLPTDDLEFIKELDQQFQLHGEMITIKVEHDNSTEVDKQNSKRTIDGELGYGAYQVHNGYEYMRPKFMFYPYSQHNIPADAPGYYPPKTDISIQPSYSYELQAQSYVQEQAHDAEQTTKVLDVPQHVKESHVGNEEPVIVLRIPGPTKYASHLQSLLQQYLEIRAAQYLRILEESELQNHQKYQTQSQQHLEYEQQVKEQLLQHHQHQPQQQQEQHVQLYDQKAHQQHAVIPEHAQVEPTIDLQPPIHQEPVVHQQQADEIEQGYSPEVAFAHQAAPTPRPVVYPEIDNIYHGYKGKSHAAAPQQQHELQQPQHVKYAPQHQEEETLPQHHQREQGYFVPAPQQPAAVQQFYYTPHAQFGIQDTQHYQNVYFMALAPQSATYQGHSTHAAHGATLQNQPIYVQEEEIGRGLEQQQHEHKQNELVVSHATVGALAENNPRQTHTKVIYTHNSEKGAADYAGSYTLPSIRPYERHSAAYHQQQLLYDQQQQNEHLRQEQQGQQFLEQQQFDSEPSQPYVSSEHEQRSAAIKPQPFNYHAHKTNRRVNRKRGAPALKATTATTTDVQVDEHLQKIRDFVRENLGAQMSTAVEFKTTAVVES